MDRAAPFVLQSALAPGLGLHTARVLSLDDPQGLARVQLRLLALGDEASQQAPLWARVCTLFAGKDRGAFWMPDVDDEVLVGFLMGDLRVPIVLGGLWSASAPPPEPLENANERKVVRSRNGNRVILEDRAGQERVIVETPGGVRLTLADGNPVCITLEDSNGNRQTLGAGGWETQVPVQVKLQTARVQIDAPLVEFNSALVRVSGIVQCQTLMTQAVVSSSYTPGAGNIW